MKIPKLRRMAILKPDRVIKGIKSITLSDEADNAAWHFDKKGTWSSITIKFNDGKKLVLQSRVCGALHDMGENHLDPI